MHARKTLLCDSVQDLRNSKRNLLGVFDRYRLPQSAMPYELRPFFLYTTLVEDEAEEIKAGKTRIKIELENPSQKRFHLVDTILPQSSAIPWNRATDGPVKAEIILEVQGITVGSYGTYWIVLEVDGREIDRVSMLVEKV